MSRLIATVVCLSFVGCAFDDPGVTGAENTPVIDDSIPVYNPYIFIEYVEPIVVIADPPVDQPVDRCTLDCYAAYDVAYEACTAGPHTVAACEEKADDAVSVCMIVECLPSFGAGASACAAKCDEERRVATADCVSEIGYAMECLTTGQEVFDTCHLAECTTTEVDKPPHIVPDLEPGGPTCREKCQALDDKHYLHCIASGEEPDRCRDDKGLTYHTCVVAHCPAGG